MGFVLLVALALVAVACRDRGPARPRPGADCRALAIHGRVLIDASPAGQQGDATRLIASLIDLCQRPGLAASTTACALHAGSIAVLRGCPALTEIVGDATEEGGGPSCRKAVDHATRLLEGDGSRPRTRAARAEARAAYMDSCAELTPGGRRCVHEATTIAAVDDCIADPALSITAP